MESIFVLLNLYLALTAGKYFFFKIEDTFVRFNDDYLLSLIIPFWALRHVKDQKLLVVTEIITSLMTLSITFELLSDRSPLDLILLYLIMAVFVFIFINILVYELVHFELPERQVVQFFLLIILLNIIVMFSRTFVSDNALEFSAIGDLENLPMGIAFIALLEMLAKGPGGKTLNLFDSLLFSSFGFFFGYPLGLVFIFLTVITGGLIGLALVISGKDLRTSLIPVSLLFAIGFSLTISFGNNIVNLIS